MPKQDKEAGEKIMKDLLEDMLKSTDSLDDPTGKAIATCGRLTRKIINGLADHNAATIGQFAAALGLAEHLRYNPKEAEPLSPECKALFREYCRLIEAATAGGAKRV